MPDAPLYPVSLVLEGRRCLVVGGGPVALRKVCGLLHCGAVVTVVAPDVAVEIEKLSKGRAVDDGTGAPVTGAVTIERRSYRTGEAGEYRLVIAATGDREINQRVYSDGEAAGVFVNAADDPGACSFMLPSVIRHDPLVVAVSTAGESPALAVWLRTLLQGFVGPEHAELANILGEARRALHCDGRSSEDVQWQSLLDGELPSLVRDGRLTEARELVARVAGVELQPVTVTASGGEAGVSCGR